MRGAKRNIVRGAERNIVRGAERNIVRGEQRGTLSLQRVWLVRLNVCLGLVTKLV